MKRTYLRISKAVAEFAKEQGAICENNVWYCVGDVPVLLEEFVIVEPRQKESVHYQDEIGPPCPKCNSHTFKNQNRLTKDFFWSCSKFPHCKGSVSWEYKSVRQVSDFLIDDKKPEAPKKKREISLPTEVQQAAQRITLLAIELHRNPADAIRWLELPKIAFNGKSPLEIMHSIEGCEKAQKLLISTFRYKLRNNTAERQNA